VSVNKRIAKSRTVEAALLNNVWMQDIQGHLTVGVLAEFFVIWDLVQDIPLQPEVEDTHSWRLDSSGQFTSKLAYVALFNGSTEFRPNILIWRSWAPRNCKFILCLVAHNCCWTADWLARRGLHHLEHCPLCDQEDETIQHLMTQCVFSRQFWHLLLGHLGLSVLASTTGRHRIFLNGGSEFLTWWAKRPSEG